MDKSSYIANVDAHGSIALKLTDGVRAPAPRFTYYDAASSTSTLAGGATPRVVNSTITVVGFVGQGGTLTFDHVDGGSAGGIKLLSFDYINADYTFTNTACSNCRNAFVSVNGGTPVEAQMPISGQVRSFYIYGDYFVLTSYSTELGHSLFWLSLVYARLQTRQGQHRPDIEPFCFHT